MISHLQKIQNLTARLNTNTHKIESIKPVLRNLHWLPIEKRIIFKINVLTFCSMQGTALQYLGDLLHMSYSITVTTIFIQDLIVCISAKTGNLWTVSAPCGMNFHITLLTNKHYHLAKRKHNYLARHILRDNRMSNVL